MFNTQCFHFLKPCLQARHEVASDAERHRAVAVVALADHLRSFLLDDTHHGIHHGKLKGKANGLIDRLFDRIRNQFQFFLLFRREHELRRARHGPTLWGKETLPELPADSAEAEYITRWDRLNRIHMLAELDETDRRLLMAFSLEGKTTKEIAGEMNMTDGQVRVRLHRIRRKIRKGMKDDA